MKKAAALQSALRSGNADKAPPPAANEAAPSRGERVVAMPGRKAVQPSRQNTVGMTFHGPEELRRQLKALAADQGRSVEDMVFEAFNLLFAAYKRPEIAPVKGKK